MTNGEPISPFGELQDEFNRELERILGETRQRFQDIPVGERGRTPATSLQMMELRARQELTGRYKRLSGATEFERMLETGEIPRTTQAMDYLQWKQRESDLIREEMQLERAIRNREQFMQSIGAPTILTKAAEFFYNKLGRPSTPTAAGMTLDYRASGLYEKALEQYNSYMERLREIVKEKSTAITYQSMYEGLAQYIQQGKVTSYEDLFTLTNDEGEPITRFNEIGKDDPNLRQVYDDISSALLGLPPDMDAEGKNYEEIIAELARKPRPPEPISIQRITVESILAALTAGEPPPTFPSGIATIEEALAIYQEAGIPDKLAKELEDIEAYTKELEGYWEAISANQSAVLQGLEEAKMPEMGAGALLLQTVAQPALTALDVFGQLYHQWIAPWGGFLFRLRVHD